MDCRWTLLVAAGLACGGVGCVGVDSGSLKPPAPQAHATSPAEQDPPSSTEGWFGKKNPPKPKPATCVAYGRYLERMANLPGRPAARQEQLRDEARRAYEGALAIDPEYLPAYSALAMFYENVGDHERAVQTYRKVLQTHRKESSLWADLGMCHARNKEWDPAVEALGTAAELEPHNRQYARTLGLCLARAGRYDDAFAWLSKAGGAAEAHYTIARMLHHLQQDEASKQHLRLALQIDPGMGSAQVLLAELEGGRAPVAAPVQAAAPAAPVDSGVIAVGFETID
jgi:tetratricopeptide (TPR) repeat protein